MKVGQVGCVNFPNAEVGFFIRLKIDVKRHDFTYTKSTTSGIDRNNYTSIVNKVKRYFLLPSRKIVNFKIFQLNLKL